MDEGEGKADHKRSEDECKSWHEEASARLTCQRLLGNDDDDVEEEGRAGPHWCALTQDPAENEAVLVTCTVVSACVCVFALMVSAK